MTSILSFTFDAQPKPIAYLLLYAPVPTPQLSLDSFAVCGRAVKAAVKAVELATPDPKLLMLDLFSSIYPCTLLPSIRRSEPYIFRGILLLVSSSAHK